MHLTYPNSDATKADVANVEPPEIEITPEMIEAGIHYMIEEAFNTLSSRATSPEFIRGFCRAVLSANQ